MQAGAAPVGEGPQFELAREHPHRPARYLLRLVKHGRAARRSLAAGGASTRPAVRRPAAAVRGLAAQLGCIWHSSELHTVFNFRNPALSFITRASVLCLTPKLGPPPPARRCRRPSSDLRGRPRRPAVGDPTQNRGRLWPAVAHYLHPAQYYRKHPEPISPTKHAFVESSAFNLARHASFMQQSALQHLSWPCCRWVAAAPVSMF